MKEIIERRRMIGVPASKTIMVVLTDGDDLTNFKCLRFSLQTDSLKVVIL